MGTRSVLAYEKPNGRIYCQYLQFDGYPTVKGKDYYTFLYKTFAEATYHFLEKRVIGKEKNLRGDEREILEVIEPKRPNKQYFRAAYDFLRYYQYQSAHSFDHHFTVKPEEFNKIDAGAEWLYLLDKQGGFHIYKGHYKGDHVRIVTLPFNFLVHLAEGREAKWIETYCEALYEGYQSTYNDEMNVPFPVLRLEYGERKQFDTTSYDEGWRDYALLFMNDVLIHKSQFASDAYAFKPTRNKQSLEINVYWPWPIEKE